MPPVRKIVAANAPLALSVGGPLIGCAVGATVYATSGVAVGLLIAAGWALTGLADDEEARIPCRRSA